MSRGGGGGGGAATKSHLSKNVLEMKFMQRTKEKYEKEAFEAEQRALFSTSVTAELEGKEARQRRFIHERSFVPCADLVSGRMSFKGRNPWIERLAAQDEADVDPEVRGRMGGVDDADFAQRYASTVDTMSKKFLRKRDRSSEERVGGGNGGDTPAQQRPPHAKKFKKPRADDF